MMVQAAQARQVRYRLLDRGKASAAVLRTIQGKRPVVRLLPPGIFSRRFVPRTIEEARRVRAHPALAEVAGKGVPALPKGRPQGLRVRQEGRF